MLTSREDVLVGDILEDVYALSDRVSHLQIDWIMRTLNDILRNEQFALADAILERAEVARLSTRQILAILTATLWAKVQCPGRAGFYQRSADEMQRREPEEWQKHLVGLE